MAFNSAFLPNVAGGTGVGDMARTVLGNMRVNIGTYVSDGGTTGGDIDTGLGVCALIILVPRGTAVSANYSVVNEAFPLVGAAGANAIATIVTDANQAGLWIAFGR